MFRQQDLALSDVVGAGDDALVLHLLDQPRSLVVADAKLALDVGGRALAVLGDDGDGLVVKCVVGRALAEAEDEDACEDDESWLNSSLSCIPLQPGSWG